MGAIITVIKGQISSKTSAVFLLILTQFVFSFSIKAQIYEENFDSYTNGTTTGSSGKWVSDASACNLVDGGFFEIRNGRFRCDDLDGTGVWQTEIIDISAFNKVKFSLDLRFNGNVENDDTVWVYYQIDGGAETLVYEGVGDLPTALTTIKATGIEGNDLVVIVKMSTNDVLDRYVLDDVLVEEFLPTTYYSRASGNWNDPASGSTDATDKHLGAAAADFPNGDEDFVVIGNSNIIDFNGSNYEVGALTINTSGTLQFTVNNAILDISNNGTVDVQSTGSLDENGSSGTRLRYLDPGFYNIISNGILFTLGRINTNLEESSLTLSGSSDITLTEHLNYNDPGTEVIYNGTATLTVPSIRFKNINNKFTNYGTTVTNRIQHLSGTTDGSEVTNHPGASLEINVEIDCFDNSWDIYNYGDFDFNGEFKNIIASEVNFYNYSGATFNYSGDAAVDDDDIYIFANYDNNTITYDGTVQDIVIPQDNYHDLIIGGTGTKTPTTADDLDIDGDLTITTTGTLDVNANTNNIVLAGDWTNSNPANFTEGSQSVTFDGTTDQVITNSSKESLFDLVVNKSSGILSIEASSDVDVSNSFSITQGTFNIGTRTFDGTGSFNASGGDVQIQTIGGTAVPELTGGITCTGGTVTVNGAGTQNIRLGTFYDLLLDGSGTKTLAGTVDVDGDLTIDAGVTLDVSGSNHSINLEGDWVNSGTFNEQSGTVTLDGSAQVNIISNGSEEGFYNLVVNNSTSASAVTLDDDVRVANQLTLTSGHIVSSSSNTLKLSSSCSVLSTSDASHVVGPVEKDLNTTTLFDFPIGDGIVYRQAGVELGAASASTYTLQYFDNEPPYFNNFNASDIDHMSEVEYWSVVKNSGADAKVMISWDPNSLVDNTGTLNLINSNGLANWQDVCSGCTTSGTVSNGEITQGSSFSFTLGSTEYFSLGSTNSDNPLAGRLYSIGAGGDWSDGNNWSYTSGGATCSCTPRVSSVVTIELGDVVNLNVVGDVKSLIVDGTLNFTSNNITNVNKNGFISVSATGTIDKVATTGGFDFVTAGADVTITNEGSFDVDTLAFSNSGGSVSFAGANAINVNNGIGFLGDNLQVSNNNATSLSSSNNISFKGDNQTFTHNSGTLSIGDDLILVGSNVQIINNSTVNITSDIDSETSATSNVIDNNGLFNLTRNIDLANAPLRINNNGSFDMNGDFVRVDAGECLVYNLASSTFNLAASTSSENFDLFANYSGNTFTYDGAGQNIINPQDNYTNLTLSSSGTKTSSNDLIIEGDLVIDATVNLDVNTNDNNINIRGDWTNNGDFDEGNEGFSETETVIFDGNTDQTITCSAGEEFSNVQINKSGGDLILADDVTVQTNSFLTLTNGNIISSTLATLKISDNSGILGGSDNSFVDGPLTKIGTDDFTFQVGDDGKWAPVEMSNITGAATIELTAQYFKSSYGDITTLFDGMLAVSNNEYWDVSSNSPLFTGADIKLFWKDITFSGISSITDIVVAHYHDKSGTNPLGWYSEGLDGVDFNTQGWIQAAITELSPFSFGATSLITLPVELTNFDAELEGDNVSLSWETAAEINNDRFEIERSYDGRNFELIAVEFGQGNSNESTNYSIVDENVNDNIVFYRLKQIDFDGTSTYSEIVIVTPNKSDNDTKIEVYPNPNTGDLIFFKANDNLGNFVNVRLLSSSGALISDVSNQFISNRTYSAIRLDEKPKPGIYFLEVIGQGYTGCEKIVFK